MTIAAEGRRTLIASRLVCLGNTAATVVSSSKPLPKPASASRALTAVEMALYAAKLPWHQAGSLPENVNYAVFCRQPGDFGQPPCI